MMEIIVGDSTKTLQSIQDVPWLCQPHVHMKSPESVIKKVNGIVEGGKDRLQVIFDFDRTLTKHHENGIVTPSSYGVFEELPNLPKDFREKSIQQLNKYRPIETNPNMTQEEKLPLMLEWWSQGLELLKGVPWDPLLAEIHVRKCNLPFRNGTEECFQLLRIAGVPVLVFSAGIGDIVKMALHNKGLLSPNVHVLANFLNVRDGKVVGYIDEIIHVFNKNESIAKRTPYYEELTGRTNVILLGDSVGDASMADGVPHDNVLKIGFLNAMVEESLDHFKELFDIVLTDDQTMDVLSQILKITL